MNIIRQPSEIDFLIEDLLRPSKTADAVLSHLVHYYPRLKNPQNVELLTMAFVKCPLFRTSINFRVVDAFKHITEAKYRVSLPTVSFKDFYSAIYNGIKVSLESDPSVYTAVIPIVTGLLLSKQQRMEINSYPAYTFAINNIDICFKSILKSSIVTYFQQRDDIQMTLVCLASVHDEFSESDYYQFINLRADLPEFLITLIFEDSLGLNNGRSLIDGDKFGPLLRQLNRMSFLFNKLIQAYPERLVFPVLVNTSGIINSYNANLLGLYPKLKILIENDDWQLIKFNYFSIIILFEGTIKKIRYSFGKANAYISEIFNLIISSLFNASFILESIGSGNFKAYNFVFDTIMDAIVQYKLTDLAKSMVLNMNNSTLNSSQFDFALQSFNRILSIFDTNFIKINILPKVHLALLNPPGSPSSVDAVHDIMLQYLTMSKSLNSQQLYDYLSLTLNKFPNELTLVECTHIISKVMENLGPSKTCELFDMLRMMSQRIDGGPVTTKYVNVNGSRVKIEEKYTTIKASYVGLLINVLHFIPEDKLCLSLHNMKEQMMTPYINNLDKMTLLDHLWDQILLCNKYFPLKGDICLNWWYENINGLPKL